MLVTSVGTNPKGSALSVRRLSEVLDVREYSTSGPNIPSEEPPDLDCKVLSKAGRPGTFIGFAIRYLKPGS